MKRLLAWLRRMERSHGPAVGILAALALLLALTLLLAAVFAVVGTLMWIDPYLGLAAALFATAYLIIRKY